MKTVLTKLAVITCLLDPLAATADSIPYANHSDLAQNIHGTSSVYATSFSGGIDVQIPAANCPAFEDCNGGADKNFNDENAFTTNITTAVPEPKNYAMLFAGLGLMGTVAHRRKKKQV